MKAILILPVPILGNGNNESNEVLLLTKKNQNFFYSQ